MKIIQSENFKKERSKRDGTGPFEDSLQNKGKKKLKRNEEPLHSLDIHCDGEDDGY